MAGIGVFGLISTGALTYLGVKAQVQKIGSSVDQLNELNTEQHGVNASLLHRMLNAVAEQSVLVSTIVNTQSHPIIKTNKIGIVTKVNLHSTHILGLDSSKIIGEKWYRFISKEDVAKVASLWSEAVRDKHSFGPISCRYTNHDTDICTLVEVVGTPVISLNDDKLLAWIIIITPIIELED